MGNEIMDLHQLATYLQRDLREVTRLASRGHLPGQKVSGQWRFHQAEINQWLETQMAAYSEEQLAALETREDRTADQQPLVTPLLSEATVGVPLRASTRTSVLQELVHLAEQSWQIFDAEALLHAVRQREETASTALPSGVAIPHPRRPLPNVLGEDVLAYGRTAHGIPFGGGGGVLTDVFFLVCCRDYRTHLQVLARLSRLLRRPEFLDELRAAEGPAETLQVIDANERELTAGS
jgi:PTS system nitrogen regulatory IIA component